MDSKGKEIAAHVSFKGAVDACHDLDLGTEQGQGEFTIVFSFLHDSLVNTINATVGVEEQAAQIIQGNFPGTTTMPNAGAPQVAYANNSGGQQPYALSVKGNQHGPLPQWLFEAAAAKGVNEVYDNRDRAAANPKYPLFKATSGGPNAPAFWEPRS